MIISDKKLIIFSLFLYMTRLVPNHYQALQYGISSFPEGSLRAHL